MKIWHHMTQIKYSHILVYSPDTDVYNIGIPIVARSTKEVMVQVNLPKDETGSLNNLIEALCLDPDLASIPRQHLPNVIQMLFICSRCDYVSFLKGKGKLCSLTHSFRMQSS